MRVAEFLYGQFKTPTGAFGALIGHLMAFKNSRRSRWVLGLLAACSGERVLEVGFGPGADAARVLEAIGPTGSYAGADLSPVMVRQASARNRRAVAGGRATFVRADIGAGLPWRDAEFDAAYSINCAQFWPDLAAGLRELERLLRPGGRAVIAVQPRRRGATEADSDRWAARVTEAALDTGLRLTQIDRGPTRPSVVAARLVKMPSRG